MLIPRGRLRVRGPVDVSHGVHPMEAGSRAEKGREYVWRGKEKEPGTADNLEFVFQF